MDKLFAKTELASIQKEALFATVTRDTEHQPRNNIATVENYSKNVFHNRLLNRVSLSFE